MNKSLYPILLMTVFLMANCGNSSADQVRRENTEKHNTIIEVTVDKDNYKPGERDALIVLKAYAEDDLATLKSYASGAQKMVMEEDYLKTNENVQIFKEKISNWTGSFKKIRYYKDEINFQEYYYMVAVISENTGSDEVTAIGLKSTDKITWKLNGFGTSYLGKSELAEMNTNLPE